MEQMQEEGEGEEMAQTEKDELILDLLMARFEDLMERRPLLPNSVLLRQNPHNVAEWQKRVTLLEDKPHEVSILKSYTIIHFGQAFLGTEIHSACKLADF